MSEPTPFPSGRYIDLRRIVGDKNQPGLLPIGKSAVYELIRSGKLPAPLKIGRRSVWRESDIIAAIERLTAEG